MHMLKIQSSTSPGFTLTEVLIAIALATILSMLVVMGLRRPAAQGRDTTREAELTQVSMALEQYYQDQLPKTYPPAASYADLDTYLAGYLNELPQDPQYPPQVYTYRVSADQKCFELATISETRPNNIVICGGNYSCQLTFCTQPGLTPLPTLTPGPTSIPSPTPAPTPTPTPTSIPTPTPTPTPTSTPTPTATPTPTPTPTPIPTPTVSYTPFADAYFADELLYHTTFQDETATFTTSDVGSSSGDLEYFEADDFLAGKYGNGLRANAAGDWYDIDMSGNFNISAGAVEFWFKPSWDHNDNIDHRLFEAYGNLSVDNYFRVYKRGTSNELRFVIEASNVQYNYVIASTNYYWSANEWVHLRFEWNDSASPANQQRILFNGVEPTHTDPSGDYNSVNFVSPRQIHFPNWNYTNADGVFDELRIFGGSSSEPDDLAQGGNTADPSEYLFYESRDYTLDFDPVDTSSRGEYLFLGSDNIFSGINVDLETNGATGGALNLDWEYWNGSGWTNLESTPGFTDNTNNFTQDGSITWSSNPTNWLPYSVNGSSDLYYIRCSLNNSSAVYTTYPIENTIKIIP